MQLEDFWLEEERYGHFTLIMGKNFVGVRRELLRSLGSVDVVNKMGDLEVSWEFNPPKDLTMGSVGACDKDCSTGDGGCNDEQTFHG